MRINLIAVRHVGRDYATRCAKLLLSYATEDSLLRLIVRDLAKVGIRVWIADVRILPETRSLRRFRTHSAVRLFHHSLVPYSMRSEWVRLELDAAQHLALHGGKRIIPFSIGLCSSAVSQDPRIWTSWRLRISLQVS